MKPVVDMATQTTTQSPPNALGEFHTGADTVASGMTSAGPSSVLPKAELGKFMQRLTKVDEGSLTSTDTSLAIVSQIDPWRTFLNNTFIAEKVKNYKLIRGTIQVQISVNAPAGAYGLYILTAWPNGVRSASAENNISLTVECARSVPHVVIDLANSTDGVLELPWIHWNDYADIQDVTTRDGVDDMWRLNLFCYQPIFTGTGTDLPVATYRIWVRGMDDVDLVIPYAQAGPFDATRESVNSASQQAIGMKPSEAAGAVAAGAAAVSTAVPFLAPLAGPVAAVASGVGSVLSWFGFTRNAEPQTPTTIIMRPYSNVANMDSVDTSEVAALSSSNAISYDPKISMPTSEDEASFAYLLKKKVLIGSVPWTPSDEAGTDLVNIPVTPHIARVGMQSGSAFTAGGYLGFPFEFWRGSMVYTLVIPMSKFHRGVIQASWAPVIQTVASDITNIRFNHIMDIGDCSVWNLTIGYVDPKVMLPNVPHLFNAAVTSTEGANGLLTLTVVNPLTSPVETAATRIWVFASALEDMTFAVPRRSYIRLADDGTTAVTEDLMTGVILQAGALGNEPKTEKSFVLVPPTTSAIQEISAGETVNSCRALAQKFTYDRNLTLAANSGYTERLYVNHFIPHPVAAQGYYQSPTNTATDLQNFSWAAWYTAMFCGLAASTRYKLMSNFTSYKIPVGVSNVETRQGRNMAATLGTAMISSINPMWKLADGEGVEITVPYYFNHKYMNHYRTYWTANILNGTHEGRVDTIELPQIPNAAAGKEYTCTVYRAYGPDIRFGTFRTVPKVQSTTSNTIPRWNWDTTPPGLRVSNQISQIGTASSDENGGLVVE